MSWVRSLDDLNPDLVVNTGDSIAHPESIQLFLDSLGPLLDRPGVFVLGSNDLFAPRPGNPLLYLGGPSSNWSDRKVDPDLPWESLRDGMATRGWLDLSNQRRPLDRRAASSSRWRAYTTRTSATIGTTEWRVARTRRPTFASASPTHPNHACSTSSPRTATTC